MGTLLQCLQLYFYFHDNRVLQKNQMKVSNVTRRTDKKKTNNLETTKKIKYLYTVKLKGLLEVLLFFQYIRYKRFDILPAKIYQ